MLTNRSLKAKISNSTDHDKNTVNIFKNVFYIMVKLNKKNQG